MPGSRAGGKAAAQTNKLRYGEDYYKKIGSKGGAAPTWSPKGFAANRDLASKAGRKGGLVSKRGPSKKTVDSQIDKKWYQRLLGK